MYISDRIRRYIARGFHRDSAAVNVLIEETLLTLFKRFPETFIFFGGASLVLFYGSQRHSRDIDLLISVKRPHSSAALNDVLKVHLCDGPAADRLELEFINQRIAQITRKRCQPELQPFLPEDLYRELDRADFRPLREAVSILFAAWL